MSTGGKVIFFTSLVLVAGGAVYTVYYFTKGKGSKSKVSNSNFDDLQKNLNRKAGSDGVVIVPVNTTSANNITESKNTAQFYNNNRVIFFDLDKRQVAKGNYSNGGRTISIDGGKTVTNNSVYTNLESAL